GTRRSNTTRRLKLIKRFSNYVGESFSMIYDFYFTAVAGSTGGGSNLYTTGVTIRDKIVELIKPPIRTSASGEMSGFEFNAMGSIPQMAVIEVRTTGRNRISPAFSMAAI